MHFATCLRCRASPVLQHGLQNGHIAHDSLVEVNAVAGLREGKPCGEAPTIGANRADDSD
jgi:hypothetical protein